MKTGDLSLHVLVKDEETYIGTLLDCMKPHVGEIVVVDTGSTDRTVQIARKFTSEIYHYPLNMDFGQARNFGLTKATTPWVFHLDADEWPTQELLYWLKEWYPTESYGGIYITRHNLVGGEPIGANTFEVLLRVFRASIRFVGCIHEQPVLPSWLGAVGAPMDAMILHHKSRERQERQNAFYQQWEEQRAFINYT